MSDCYAQGSGGDAREATMASLDRGREMGGARVGLDAVSSVHGEVPVAAGGSGGGPMPCEEVGSLPADHASTHAITTAEHLHLKQHQHELDDGSVTRIDDGDRAGTGRDTSPSPPFGHWIDGERSASAGGDTGASAVLEAAAAASVVSAGAAPGVGAVLGIHIADADVRDDVGLPEPVDSDRVHMDDTGISLHHIASEVHALLESSHSTFVACHSEGRAGLSGVISSSEQAMSLSPTHTTGEDVAPSYAAHNPETQMVVDDIGEEVKMGLVAYESDDDGGYAAGYRKYRTLVSGDQPAVLEESKRSKDGAADAPRSSRDSNSADVSVIGEVQAGQMLGDVPDAVVGDICAYVDPAEDVRGRHGHEPWRAMLDETQHGRVEARPERAIGGQEEGGAYGLGKPDDAPAPAMSLGGPVINLEEEKARVNTDVTAIADVVAAASVVSAAAAGQVVGAALSVHMADADVRDDVGLPEPLKIDHSHTDDADTSLHHTTFEVPAPLDSSDSTFVVCHSEGRAGLTGVVSSSEHAMLLSLTHARGEDAAPPHTADDPETQTYVQDPSAADGLNRQFAVVGGKPMAEMGTADALDAVEDGGSSQAEGTTFLLPEMMHEASHGIHEELLKDDGAMRRPDDQSAILEQSGREERGVSQLRSTGGADSAALETGQVYSDALEAAADASAYGERIEHVRARDLQDPRRVVDDGVQDERAEDGAERGIGGQDESSGAGYEELGAQDHVQAPPAPVMDLLAPAVSPEVTQARLCKAMAQLACLVKPMPHSRVPFIDEADMRGVRTKGTISELQVQEAFHNAQLHPADIHDIQSELHDRIASPDFFPFQYVANGAVQPDYDHPLFKDFRQTHKTTPAAAEQLVQCVLNETQEARPPTTVLWNEEADMPLLLPQYAEHVLAMFRAIKSHKETKMPAPPIAAASLEESAPAGRRKPSAKSRKKRPVMTDEEAQECQVIDDSVTDDFAAWLAQPPRSYDPGSARVKNMIASLRQIVLMLRGSIDNATDLLDRHLVSIIMDAEETKALTKDVLVQLEAGASSCTLSADGVAEWSEEHARADRLWHMWELWTQYCAERDRDPEHKPKKVKAMREENRGGRGGRAEGGGSSKGASSSSRKRRTGAARGLSPTRGCGHSESSKSQERRFKKTKQGKRSKATGASAGGAGGGSGGGRGMGTYNAADDELEGFDWQLHYDHDVMDLDDSSAAPPRVAVAARAASHTSHTFETLSTQTSAKRSAPLPHADDNMKPERKPYVLPVPLPKFILKTGSGSTAVSRKGKADKSAEKQQRKRKETEEKGNDGRNAKRVNAAAARTPAKPSAAKSHAAVSTPSLQRKAPARQSSASHVANRDRMEEEAASQTTRPRGCRLSPHLAEQLEKYLILQDSKGLAFTGLGTKEAVEGCQMVLEAWGLKLDSGPISRTFTTAHEAQAFTREHSKVGKTLERLPSLSPLSTGLAITLLTNFLSYLIKCPNGIKAPPLPKVVSPPHRPKPSHSNPPPEVRSSTRPLGSEASIKEHEPHHPTSSRRDHSLSPRSRTSSPRKRGASPRKEVSREKPKPAPGSPHGDSGSEGWDVTPTPSPNRPRRDAARTGSHPRREGSTAQGDMPQRGGPTSFAQPRPTRNTGSSEPYHSPSHPARRYGRDHMTSQHSEFSSHPPRPIEPFGAPHDINLLQENTSAHFRPHDDPFAYRQPPARPTAFQHINAPPPIYLPPSDPSMVAHQPYMTMMQPLHPGFVAPHDPAFLYPPPTAHTMLPQGLPPPHQAPPSTFRAITPAMHNHMLSCFTSLLLATAESVHHRGPSYSKSHAEALVDEVVQSVVQMGLVPGGMITHFEDIRACLNASGGTRHVGTMLVDGGFELNSLLTFFVRWYSKKCNERLDSS